MYYVRFACAKEDALRAEALASHLAERGRIDFADELRALNNSVARPGQSLEPIARIGVLLGFRITVEASAISWRCEATEVHFEPEMRTTDYSAVEGRGASVVARDPRVLAELEAITGSLLRLVDELGWRTHVLSRDFLAWALERAFPRHGRVP